MDVVIAGFGTVGQGIAEVIAQKREMFTGNFHQDVRIVGVFDSTSYEASPGGLDPSTLIARKMSTGKVGTRQDKAPEELLLSLDYDTLIETTPTNIVDAEPGLSNILTALNAGKKRDNFEQRTSCPEIP